MPSSLPKSLPQLVLRTELYRRLTPLIRSTHTEEEIVKATVDALADALPNVRVAFSVLQRSGRLEIRYSRNVPGVPNLDGVVSDLSGAKMLMDAFFRHEIVSCDDATKDPLTQELIRVQPIFRTEGARIYCPFEEGEDTVTTITLTNPKPEPWDPEFLETLREVGEFVHLLRRETRTREMLARNERTFREFSEHVQAVLYMTDPVTHEVYYVSPAYERVWGRPIAELRENPLAFIEGIHPDDRHLMWERINSSQQRARVLQFRLVKPNGETIWVKDSNHPVFGENGEFLRVVGIVEDITELKAAQEQLELTQAQMISKAKFAALGEMASGIAHEINNPLAVIHGLASQLREGHARKKKIDTSLLDSLDTIEKMIARISAITKGLRTFSRQADVDPLVPSDLGGLVEETLAIFRSRALKAGATLTVSLPKESLRVRCRSSELIQVLLNLLNNALDATEGFDDRRLRLTLHRDVAEACLAVEDNGPGVPAAIRENIFLPFFTTKDVGRGTGLGLSISKGIIEGHGGRLELDATAPQTRFVVSLPLENA